MTDREFTRVAPTTSGGPYRTRFESDSNDGPLRKFVYAPVNATRGRHGVLVLYLLFWLPLMTSTIGAWIAGSKGAMAGLFAGAVCALWTWRARKNVGGAVLTVDGQSLTVAIRGRHTVYASLPLSNLANVALDLKTIERVMDGGAAIPALRLIDSKVGPKIDTARIVLVDGDGREVGLTEEYLPHSEATDSLGKIRVFLRKNGWVPEDERETA
jgi:hypothetical protein